MLRDVNLTIERGEFVAIVGYSGSGKTTLLRVMAGLQPTTSGGVYVLGRRLTAEHREVLADVGFTPDTAPRSTTN